MSGSPPPAYTDHQLLKGVRCGDRDVLEYVYAAYYDRVRRYVCDNSGTTADAEDHFQNMLVLTHRTLQTRPPQPDTRFEVWFFAICRNQWLMHLRKKQGRHLVTFDEKVQSNIEDDRPTIDQLLIKEQRLSRFIDIFKQQLGRQCQTILRMFYNKQLSHARIAELLEIKPGYAKTKKYKCIQRLDKLVRAEGLSADDFYSE